MEGDHIVLKQNCRKMPKILVIDDELDTLDTIVDILEKMIPDAKIISSLSGRDGMKKAKEELPS